MSDKKTKTTKQNAVVARSDDGSIQITFTIPYKEIKERRQKALKEMGQNIEVPGFRKGQAPLEKVEEKVNQNTLLEKTLSEILPKLFCNATEEHNINPIIYPKFELLKAKVDEDWQIVAKTCEAPKINLGKYKEDIKGTLRAEKIWTPGKGDPAIRNKNVLGQENLDENKEKTHEEKQQIVLKKLLESVNVKVPQILIEEEANSKLSNLLSRLEKLGLTLESYLASIGKTAQSIRKEYEDQAKEGLSIDFILTKIAEEEDIKVDEKEVSAAVETASQDPSSKASEPDPNQKRFVEAILKRRKALDYLINLQ